MLLSAASDKMDTGPLNRKLTDHSVCFSRWKTSEQGKDSEMTDDLFALYLEPSRLKDSKIMSGGGGWGYKEGKRWW